jgi:hypothetical protein
MDKIQKNVQTVRHDELNNIATWISTAFIAKNETKSCCKLTLAKFELAPNIKASN